MQLTSSSLCQNLSLLETHSHTKRTHTIAQPPLRVEEENKTSNSYKINDDDDDDSVHSAVSSPLLQIRDAFDTSNLNIVGLFAVGAMSTI